jgi:hypothetical protein
MTQLSVRSRVLTAVAALLMLALFFVPLWRIQLHAPQYPEGLGMVIRAHTVQGAREFDLKNINELNHYIGMKVIEPDAIPELRIMPWIIGALAVFALVAAAVARRGVVIAWLVSVATLGVVGMVDFYKWEYDYGHNLDLEHAIIKIPGMSYQPPLIGTKQLLNFTAASWPALGAVCLGVARPAATEFSFFMAMPVLAGASLLKLAKHHRDLARDDLSAIAVGFTVSFLVALAVVHWLLRYVAGHNFSVFILYRIGLGIIVLVLLAGGVSPT